MIDQVSMAYAIKSNLSVKRIRILMVGHLAHIEELFRNVAIKILSIM